MTNNTYSEEDIRRVIAKRMPYLPDVKLYADEFMAELRRPKVEFSEGQVVADTRFDRTYIRFNSEVADPEAMRPLTLTEHGKAVSDLVESMDNIDRVLGDLDSISLSTLKIRKEKALKAFNAAIGEGE